jgi:hypothetical protein
MHEEKYYLRSVAMQRLLELRKQGKKATLHSEGCALIIRWEN